MSVGRATGNTTQRASAKHVSGALIIADGYEGIEKDRRLRLEIDFPFWFEARPVYTHLAELLFCPPQKMQDSELRCRTYNCSILLVDCFLQRKEKEVCSEHRKNDLYKWKRGKPPRVRLKRGRKWGGGKAQEAHQAEGKAQERDSTHSPADAS